jgi:hypothetical protein
MKKILLSSVCFTVLIFGSGCASIMSGTSQNVSIQSEPSDAKTTIFNRKGQAVVTQQTPFITPLKRREKYKLHVEKEGYQPLDATLKKGMNGWYLGNVVFGGLLGILIIDPATGAMWSYQDPVKAELAKLGSTEQSVLGKPRHTVPADEGRKY